MRALTKIAVFFLVISIVSVGLNFFGRGKDQPGDSGQKYPPVKDTVNVIVSVNWTGSIGQIGKGYGSPSYYRNQLEKDVKNELWNLIKDLREDNSLNISYCYFGLVQPDGSGEPNPDFKENFIKNFKSNCTGFKEEDWKSFLNKLRNEQKGNHTALTVARQLSVVITAEQIKEEFDANYLILITDNYYNVTDEADISAEMDHLEKWSNGLPSSSNKRIQNINFAKEKSREFLRYYTLKDINIIPILPGGLTKDDRHFEIMLFKIEPKTKQEPSNFLDYPTEIQYEDLSKDLIRVPLILKYKDDAIKKGKYTHKSTVLSAVYSEDEDNGCFYRESFESRIIPPQLIIQQPPRSSFKVELSVYYDYHDNDIFIPYREKHEISITCKKTGSGKILWILPVKGTLLEMHKSLGILEGQIAAANFWNFFLLVTLFFGGIRLLLPIIRPPVPKVKFHLGKGRESI